MDLNQMGENVRYTPQGVPIVSVYSAQRCGISLEEERRMRRVLKENKIIGHLPRTTPKPPSINVRAAIDAYNRKPAARKPSTVHTVKARVILTDAAGRKVEWKAGSVSKRPAADLLATGSKAEVQVGSVSKCPAADLSATRKSVLKRPRVDLGEADQVLAGNLNPGQDSSATGTIEEVKRGSVINKDLGGSSEIVSII